MLGGDRVLLILHPNRAAQQAKTARTEDPEECSPVLCLGRQGTAYLRIAEPQLVVDFFVSALFADETGA